MVERIERMLGVLAFAVVATGVYGWRSLRRADAAPGAGGAGKAAPSAVPSPQLRQLIPFAVPISDSQLVVRAVGDSVPLLRDPFANQLPSRIADVRSVAEPRPSAAADSTQQWHVTATLISSVRRAAIINDVLTYVGDRIPGGGKLVSVESDRVVLTDARGTPHTVKADKDGT